MDHFANVVSANCHQLWENYEASGSLNFCRDSAFLQLAAQHYSEGRYIDIHCWVFTPWYFLETLGRIMEDTKMGFDLQYFQTTMSHDLEFYVRLVRVSSAGTDRTTKAAAASVDALWPQKYCA